MSNATNTKPTVVLVHGACADASSWNDVISTLLAHEEHGVTGGALGDPVEF